MKRMTVILMALALVLAGATVVLAQNAPQAKQGISRALPQALQGVNLNTAQVVTPAQAQQIRGASGTTSNTGIYTGGTTINSLGLTNTGTYTVAGNTEQDLLTQLYGGLTPPSGLPLSY